MSFTKSFTMPTGFAITYWRPNEIKLDPINKRIEVMIYGYKDKPAFDAGATHALSRQVILEPQAFQGLETLDVIPKTVSYLKLIDSILQEVVSELGDAVKNVNDVI